MRCLLLPGICSFLLLPGCRDHGVPPPAEGLTVVATIFPLADAAARIAGSDANVVCLVGPGRSPHDFSLKPIQVQAIANAHLVLMVGGGLDDWALRAGESARGRGAKVLQLCQLPEISRTADDRHHDDGDIHQEGTFDHDHAHAHGGADPHVWLDPVFMQQFARQISAVLGELDPPNSGQYQQRAQRFVEQLEELDRDYRSGLAGVDRRCVLTYHRAFTYIAWRYGLQIASVYELTGGGLGARQLEEVVDFVRRNDVKVVFTEPQFPADKLQVLAERTGVRVEMLDPLGNPDQAGYDSYVAMMRSNLSALVAALKEQQ